MYILLTLPLFGCLLFLIIFALLKKKWVLTVFAILLIAVVNVFAEIISFGRVQFREDKSFLTVLAYNVQNYSEYYSEKQTDIAKDIISVSPDIAYLCEFVLKKNWELDSILTKAYSYKRYYRSGTNCVFYSKHAIDSIVGIHTKESIKKHSLNNKVHVYIGIDTITIVGCHLSSSNHHVLRGYQNRAKEADAIYENIKDEHYPTIVMGDLNDISGSYAVERIKEAGLKDAWWNGGVGYGSTFHNKWLRLRLDHILYNENKLDLQYVKVIDSNLSDHGAVAAGFTIKK